MVISSTSSARLGKTGTRQAQLGDDRLDGPRFLLRRFAQADRQVGPQDGQHDAGHAAAGADVEHPLALLQQLAELVTIDDIASDEFFERRVPREVHPLVPRPEQPAVAVEQFDLLGRDRDLLGDERLLQLVGERREVGLGMCSQRLTLLDWRR